MSNVATQLHRASKEALAIACTLDIDGACLDELDAKVAEYVHTVRIRVNQLKMVFPGFMCSEDGECPRWR